MNQQHATDTRTKPYLVVDDGDALRTSLTFKGATTGSNGSAHFDLRQPHTYVLVTSTAFDEIAVLLDEGYGHEDYVFPNSQGLGRMIDDFLWSASRGDLASTNGLRSFAVEGIKRLRALRETEGRA
jgi:hypothetical protein